MPKKQPPSVRNKPTQPLADELSLDEKQGIVHALRRLAIELEGDHRFLQPISREQGVQAFLSCAAGSYPRAIGSDVLLIVQKLLWARGLAGENGPPGLLARWWEEEKRKAPNRRPDPLAVGCLPDVEDAYGVVKQLENCGVGLWPWPPPNAVSRLRSIAEQLEKGLGEDKLRATAITRDELKLIARQQARAENKIAHIQEAAVVAYRLCGSYRRAAAFLSIKLSEDIDRYVVERAIKRAGGIEAVRNGEDSPSIQRVVASQERDRQEKFAAPPQPPEID